jgi:hypothetical protein
LWNYRFRQEEVVAVKIVVHAAGDLSGFGAKGGSAAFKKYNDNDASEIGVGVAGEPSEAGSGSRAGASFA